MEGTRQGHEEIGDHARTFLTQFNRFMTMNQTSDRPRCIESLRVLSLFDRQPERRWLDPPLIRLARQSQKPHLPGTTAWDSLESGFRDAFTDYAEKERASNELRKLSMKDDHVDDYATTFKQWAHRAGTNLDNPMNLQAFARGLP